MQIEILTGEAGWPLITALEAAVYPPEVMARVSWRNVAWAHAELRILIREDGAVACHVGIYQRDGTHDGVVRRITGIGGVMTAPDARRRGYASAAMREAAQLMSARGTDFGLLFCEPHNEHLYEGLGWRKFGGEVFCEQPRGRVRFDLMATMVLPVCSTADTGVIDLRGLPW